MSRLLALLLLLALPAHAGVDRLGPPQGVGHCPIVRDATGAIHRSKAALAEFKRRTGYPKGRKGYVIDHIVALQCGGCDKAANMQWMTIADGKAKDKWEGKVCAKLRKDAAK